MGTIRHLSSIPNRSQAFHTNRANMKASIVLLFTLACLLGLALGQYGYGGYPYYGYGQQQARRGGGFGNGGFFALIGLLFILLLLFSNNNSSTNTGFSIQNYTG